MTLLWWGLAIALVVFGMLGTVLPVLPGAPLVFGGLLVAAWIDSFQEVGAFTLFVIGVLTVVTIIIDFAAAALGVKRVGASTLAIWGAVLGTLFGVMFGIVGLLVGPFLGALVGEYVAKRDIARAGAVGLVTWIALLVGAALKLSLVVSMLGIFCLSYLL